MSDSSPRRMPTEVASAYRDPIYLRGLLLSGIYDKQDRDDVFRRLMSELVEQRGHVWIPPDGEDECRVSDYLLSASIHMVNKIDVLSSLEDYGGEECILPILAKLMQPRWAEWWSSFVLRSWNDALQWRTRATLVLGQRQLAWLAAQYARTVIDDVAEYERAEAIRAIDAAESWAIDPSTANASLAFAAYQAIRADAGSPAVAAAGAAASVAHSQKEYEGNFSYTMSCAANSSADDFADAYDDLGRLTRRLITPTLVTSASRGVRRSFLRR